MASRTTIRLLLFSAFLAMMLLFLAAPMPRAATTQIPQYCQGITSSSVLTTSPSPLSSLASMSLLIMLLMLAVAGVLYSIGYAFRFDKLTRFSKMEIGEVLISAAIMIIFLGSVSLSNAVAIGSQSQVFALSHGLFNAQNLYQTDCGYLSQTISLLWGNFGALLIDQVFVTFLSRLAFAFTLPKVGVSIGGTGIKASVSALFSVRFSPLRGLILVGGDVGVIAGIYGGMGILTSLGMFCLTMSFALISVTFFLGLIYSLFPLFLYIGIILRTMPWTRAAGGAFLGVFVGFYIFFPLMMLFLLRLNPPPADYSLIPICIPTGPAGTGVYCTVTGSLLTDFVNFMEHWGDILKALTCGVFAGSSAASSCLFTTLVQDTMAPAFYSIFALIVSFLLAFDFSSAIARFLGAPSLQTRHMVMKVL